MKSRKIFSLLFTLAQLIFFIKLIEYCVDGVESRSLTATTTIATTKIPQVQRQQVEILNGASEIGKKPSEEARSLNRFFAVNGGQKEKVTVSNNNTSVDSQKNSDETEFATSGGRDCPACANGECDANITSFAFPFFQLKVGLFAIALWYVLFLFVWKYPKHQPAMATGGYGGYSAPVSGGYSAPVMPTYGPPPVQGGYSSGGYSNSKSSSFGGLLTNVFDAIDKYSN